jgi:hypothetical protein
MIIFAQIKIKMNKLINLFNYIGGMADEGYR